LLNDHQEKAHPHNFHASIASPIKLPNFAERLHASISGVQREY
jgi:hypothetical protein